ncbi:MAG TPA: hypothetical protein VF198_03315 [Vicinamibacterales bacterium]
MLTDAIKAVLKRGALVAAANWQVVVIQFVAESAFKGLLVVPALGAAFLVALIVGGEVTDFLDRRLTGVLAAVVAALHRHPGALAGYLAGLLVVVVGGSVLMFVAKAGTVRVLVEAERAAGPIERPPLRARETWTASRFTLERFGEGIDRYKGRFVRLGLLLLAVYAAAGLAYLAGVAALHRWTAALGLPIAGSMLAAVTALALAALITVVNLFYLLAQILVVALDCGVRRALGHLTPLVRREWRLLGGVFLVMLVVVLLATAASILATGALGFVGFVPVVGLAMLPLQLLAWLARGLLFQFLGLTALGAYARVLRGAMHA